MNLLYVVFAIPPVGILLMYSARRLKGRRLLKRVTEVIEAAENASGYLTFRGNVLEADRALAESLGSGGHARGCVPGVGVVNVRTGTRLGSPREIRRVVEGYRSDFPREGTPFRVVVECRPGPLYMRGVALPCGHGEGGPLAAVVGVAGRREDEEPRFVFGGVVRADRVFTTFTVLMLFKHIMGRFKELIEERADVEWTDEEEILAVDPDLATRAEMEAVREVLGVEVDEDVLKYVDEVLLDAFGDRGGLGRSGVPRGGR